MGRKSYAKITPDPDQPPFLKSWTRVYIFVLSFLAFLVILFYVFMKVYT